MKLKNLSALGLLLLATVLSACAPKTEVVALQPRTRYVTHTTYHNTATVTPTTPTRPVQSSDPFRTRVVNSYDEQKAADESVQTNR